MLAIAPETTARPDFDQMTAGFYRELHPVGFVEQVLFDELVSAAWQLQRIRRIERESGDGEFDRLGSHHTRVQCDFLRCLKQLRSEIDGRSPEHLALFLRRSTGLHLVPPAA